MAIWQYDVYLVPDEDIPEAFLDNPTDDPFLWKRRFSMDKMSALLVPIATQTVSWAEDSLRIWGHEDHNCVKVCFEDGFVEEVIIRLDVGQLTDEFGHNILAMADNLHCQLVEAETLTAYPPHMDQFRERIRMSSAAKFVRNPHLYLEKLAYSEVNRN